MQHERHRLPHHRILPAAILLPAWVSFVILSGVRGDGLVLCFGADGHVAVESAQDGRCHGCEDDHGTELPRTRGSLGAFVSTSGPSLSSLPESTACGSCVDVELEGHEARSSVSPRAAHWQPDAEGANPFWLAWSPPSSSNARACVVARAAVPTGHLALLRTVILRT